ncbi:MAG TPA: M12 family metallo-peptidase [Kofleriaceae bacterium]|nr:M12 family metallo-peptidase [Kofleriaceae bacterium]
MTLVRWLISFAVLSSLGCGGDESEHKLSVEVGSARRSGASPMKANLRSDDLVLKSADGRDLDGDRLSDADEQQWQTDPGNPDTDGDGLLDGWEVYGVNGIDLRQLGASPRRRDVFVEMDYMTRADASNGLASGDDVIKRIVRVFAEAPIQNPDGSSGITLHLERGEEVPYDANLSPLDREFYALKQRYFDSSTRGPVYHYMIWANAYNNGSSSGYSMSTPGSDFIVTLGRWNGNRGGTDDEKVGTFVHELGHNLGLRHGSTDDTSYKPNHLSIMNYSFQTSGVSINDVRSFGYQPFAMKALDETALSEQDGLQPKSPTLDRYETMWRVLSGATRKGPAGGPLDWTGNKKLDDQKVAVDLNDDRVKNVLGATVDEWSALKYRAGTIGSTQGRNKLHDLAKRVFVVQPVEELTAEEDQRTKASLLAP